MCSFALRCWKLIPKHFATVLHERFLYHEATIKNPLRFVKVQLRIVYGSMMLIATRCCQRTAHIPKRCTDKYW